MASSYMPLISLRASLLRFHNQSGCFNGRFASATRSISFVTSSNPPSKSPISSPKFLNFSGGHCRMRRSYQSSSSVSPSIFPSTPSPWLMLPPAFEGGEMVYKFYNIAEDRVVSHKKKEKTDQLDDDEQSQPSDDSCIKGSSRGWLALYNEGNHDLFLSNPLSRRHVRLPPIPNIDAVTCHRNPYVRDVIISSSPDQEDCRALMKYGCRRRLAFCCPGRSSEWTPIGTLHDDCESFAYSSRQKLFFCLMERRNQRDAIEAWDLQDPLSPRMVDSIVIEKDDDTTDEDDDEEEEEKDDDDDDGWVWNMRSLVVAEQTDELFLVKRYILEHMAPDGKAVGRIYFCPPKGFDHSYPYKTIGFDVYKYDPEKREFIRSFCGDSLDGMALFIGSNDGSALSASEFPESIKPDSIYFTDVINSPPWREEYYSGHDIGIFNYKDSTYKDSKISPCYYPCDVQSFRRIDPPPMWFTPSPH